MLTQQAQAELQKQKYALVGSHSAVKTCGWTKKMIKGEGGCYKLKFYGIMSHQCMQMTTSMSCANRCTFCWRGYKAPVSKDWAWDVDEPKLILEESKKAHHKQLTGLNGIQGMPKAAYNQSKTIKHVALSLTGEPITYPKMNELVDKFHKDGISTFLVTNAQYPEAIKNLKPITQLYISVDAPTKEMLKQVDKPLFSDYWERLEQSLDYLKQKKARTCIRLTMIKEVNMSHHKEYAQLVQKGDPDFLEVKAYMLLGASRDVYRIDNMPRHEEVVQFTKELIEYLPNYEIVSEHIPSRVVLVAKKSFKMGDVWQTWIDFEKFQELATSGKEFSAKDYNKKTPKVGLSGKTTADYTKTWKKVNETTPEMIVQQE